MAKRSTGQFVRRKHDLYRTWDPRAVEPLIPHLKPDATFIEPCAGHGDLIKLLTQHGLLCLDGFDIDPQDEDTFRGDATKFILKKHMKVLGPDAPLPDYFISNPPWTRALLHAIIFNLYWQLPTWLLFDADWVHTDQARPYVPLLRKIVSVGRLRWIEETTDDAKDNVAWHLFAPGGETQFVGRA